MENLGKKVGFLKGLMEGMSFDTESANGKLMAGIVGLLGDLSDRVEAIDELLEDPLDMNACLPGCVWNATPRSRSPLESNMGFSTQA